MADLFQPGEARDDAYRNLRDAAWCVDWKAFCESLWARFEPYADRHFLSEVRVQFHQRFWEMYLGVAFLERGYALHKHKDGGPEFWIDIEGRRYWFDAIAPMPGTGEDAVPDEIGRNEARTVPVERIILRYTSALAAKREKWRRDLECGRVGAGDGYVVAINDRSMRWAWLGGEMPYIVKGLYGFGNLTVAFDVRTKEIVETKHEYRPTIKKVCGEGISSQAFAARECPEVSAILYSSVNAANFPGTLGADFMILHNNEPNVPLPRGALQFRCEYAIDGEHLVRKDWSATEEPAR